MQICTAEEISPEDLISLVSCNCNGDCSNGHCTCKKNNVACTDSCGSLVRILIRLPSEHLGTDEKKQEEEDREEEEKEEEKEEEGEESNMIYVSFPRRAEGPLE